MIYHHLFNKFRKKDKVAAAVVGAGHYGTAIVTQQKYVNRLCVPIVADANPETAKNAFFKAGIPVENIVYAGDAAEAGKMIAAGKYVYTDNAMLIMDMPGIDVLVEATGVPEAGARYCLAAIEKGKHVAAVSKEMDSCIGPVLRRIAIEKGLVYSPVDGDQPALLMQMVEWARLIGLTVISAGKARDAEFILDEKKRTVSVEADGITVHKDVSVSIPENYIKYFEMIPNAPGAAREYITRRLEALKDMPLVGDFDLCELTMMANAVGLHPDVPETSRAPLRITELPIAYCSTKNGGIYKDEGVADIVTNLRRPDEGGMGGGVYMVVRCDNAYSNYILTTKGQIPNYDKSAALIYRPYHLCGVETSSTLLCQGLLNIDTGAQDYIPSFDFVKIAARDIRKGEKLGNDHDTGMSARMVPATKRNPDSAVPAHLITGNAAKVDIRKGQTITYSMIEEPAGSVLWDLRAQQEKMFV
ncbi:MAG: SAF domain-containing protein [Spirochaetales bacterium]|jgi:predicted homoserine dehydrogenase-like protein|nr:SAF domain-containing protein [Spirochaetales bacterium]